MIVRILGLFDIIAASVLIAIGFGMNIYSGIIIFIAVILIIKGLFVLTKSIASGFDLLGAVLLLISLAAVVPKILLLISGFLIIQKGFLSLV